MEDQTWVRLYARGFLLSPTPVSCVDELEHFRRYDLPGYTLYVDEIADIGVARSGDDWLVTIGKLLPLSTGIIAAQGSDIAAELLQLLQRDGFAGVEEALYDLGGRHAVLLKSGDQVHAYHDAAGHRTVYFNPHQARIASHFDMLHRLTDIDQLSCPVGSTNFDGAPEGLWDVTENPLINVLLPNHRLHLTTGTQTRFGLVEPNRYKQVGWSDKIETIYQLWHEQLEQLLNMSPGRPIGISLSGGLDSRTVLAHMKPYRDHIRAFTYTASNVATGAAPKSFWQRTMVADHNILAQLTDHLSEDFHVLVKPTTRNLTTADTAVLQRNAMRNHGWPFVRMYKELFPDMNSIHVRGNFVEMGRLIRGRLDIRGQRERLAPIINQVARRRKPNRKLYRKFFWNKVDELQYDRIHEDFEYTDAYHWENRSSRWYAEIANETDTVFDSIVPVNVRRIYEILLSPRPDVRQSAQLQYDLIHRAWPELLAYGINDEQDRYTQTLRPRLLGER